MEVACNKIILKQSMHLIVVLNVGYKRNVSTATICHKWIAG